VRKKEHEKKFRRKMEYEGQEWFLFSALMYVLALCVDLSFHSLHSVTFPSARNTTTAGNAQQSTVFCATYRPMRNLKLREDEEISKRFI
jgi:hypothetical protein